MGLRLAPGDNVTVFEVPADEAVDIDTMQDWIVCEAMLSRRLIVFRVDGRREELATGMCTVH